MKSLFGNPDELQPRLLMGVTSISVASDLVAGKLVNRWVVVDNKPEAVQDG